MQEGFEAELPNSRGPIEVWSTTVALESAERRLAWLVGGLTPRFPARHAPLIGNIGLAVGPRVPKSAPPHRLSSNCSGVG